uniref:Methylthioribose-1-phosphate isomerase n=1 Tax=Acrobeloides nanus TaxID=290746 RepID=A0A914BUC5_9BILA
MSNTPSESGEQNCIVDDNADSFDASDLKPIKKVVNLHEIGDYAWTPLAEIGNPLRSLEYNPDTKTLRILDQLLLPGETKHVEVKSVEDGYAVIKNMQVRGAPLIATVGTLSLAVDLNQEPALSMEYDMLFSYIEERCQHLLSSRPTAINLKNSINQIDKILDLDLRNMPVDPARLRKSIQDAAYHWYISEMAENDLLLKNATLCIESFSPSSNYKFTIMTICNTGSLATSSFGTALGVIRQLHVRNRLEKAIALETRPYNQGSRLTAYELLHDKIPFMLITDSMAAAAMRTFGVDAVLVGADQIALNGDTANKIGTYSLAVLAHHHKIPFYVVAPVSTINQRILSGSAIKIEERPALELITFNGKPSAPQGTPVWNPAFDVTPASLISGILTDKGNFLPENLASLFA